MDKIIKDTIHAKGIEIGIYTTDFKRIEFDTFKNDAGTDAFTFSIKKWNIEQNIAQPQRLEMLCEMALNQLRTIQGLDFSSQRILTISDKTEESK